MRLLLALTMIAAMATTCIHAHDITDATWIPLGEIPDGTGGPGQPRNLGMGGPMAGTHNGALIIAGGSNFPVAAGRGIWSDETVKIFHDTIWVATAAGRVRSTGGSAGWSSARSLVWHKVSARLPNKLAYGAAASNRLGMFLIGGTDGRNGTGEAWLLRWDQSQQQLRMHPLPAMPVPSAEGTAAIIGQTLFVLVGSDGAKESADLYSLDLSRINPRQFDDDLADRQPVVFSVKRGQSDENSSPWCKLASIPATDGHSMARSKAMMAAQSDGKQTRLYVMGGQRVVKAEEFPDAAPAGFGNDRPLIHFFNDVWAFTPDRRQGPGKWNRLGVIGAPFDTDGRAAGSAVALGKSKILLASSAKDNLLRIAYADNGGGWAKFPKHPGFERQSLVYDVRSKQWSLGQLAPLVPDPLDGPDHQVASAAVTTSAVCIGGTIVLPTGEVRPRVRSPLVWAINMSRLGHACNDGL